MNLTDRIPLNFQFACENLSCMINFNDKIKLVNQWGLELCTVENGKETERIRLSRSYDRLTYCCKTGGYFAICRRNPECIFVLDENCRETDCLKLRSDIFSLPVKDIWYDPQSRLIWLVTSIHIYIINCSGDLLNIFMTAPAETKYKAVCTYENFVFTAFSKENCLHLAAYTKQGVYLEKISLGGEYTVRNLQPVLCSEGLYLNILALKDYRFPIILKIRFNGFPENQSCFRQLGDVIVEYNSIPDNFCLTCNVELSDNINT